jgi:hypothetical protein
MSACLCSYVSLIVLQFVRSWQRKRLCTWYAYELQEGPVKRGNAPLLGTYKKYGEASRTNLNHRQNYCTLLQYSTPAQFFWVVKVTVTMVVASRSSEGQGRIGGPGGVGRSISPLPGLGKDRPHRCGASHSVPQGSKENKTPVVDSPQRRRYAKPGDARRTKDAPCGARGEAGD